MSTTKHGRANIHAPISTGERIADTVAEQMGSWRFIIIQSAVVGLWILANLVAVALRWDPYPFILLNLLFSTQAAYAAPVIMMSQNRQAAKDRLRDDHEAEEVEQMFAINEQQLEILQLLRQLVKDDDPPPPAPIAAEQQRVARKIAATTPVVRRRHKAA
jgi:uncharacterized membrane protein